MIVKAMQALGRFLRAGFDIPGGKNLVAFFGGGTFVGLSGVPVLPLGVQETGPDEMGEERMGVHGPRFELRVELTGDEMGMVRKFDDFDQNCEGRR